MTIDINAMGPDEWRKLLVPTHDVMARVGGFLIDAAKLNLVGLLDIYNQAVKDATVFALLIGLAESNVQQMGLRESSEAMKKLDADIADHKLKALDEGNDNEGNEN